MRGEKKEKIKYCTVLGSTRPRPRNLGIEQSEIRAPCWSEAPRQPRLQPPTPT